MFERPEEVIAARSVVRSPDIAPDERAARALGASSPFDAAESAAGPWIDHDALDLCAKRLTPTTLAAVADGAAERVRALFVASNRLGPEGVRALSAFEKLETLWAGDNQWGAPALATFVTRASSLVTLSVGRAALGVTDVAPLARSIEAHPALDALDLAQNELAPTQLVALASAAHARSASVLALDAHRIDRDTARALGSLFAAWPRLEALRLDACELGDDGLEALAPALCEAKSLVSLGLASNALSDRGASIVAQIVRTLPALRALGLGFVRAERASGARPNAITDAGIAEVLEAVRARRALRSLDLRGNHLAPDSFATIVSRVTDTGSIDAIDAPSLHASSAGDALRAALARNANAGRPRETAAIRRFLAPLRRLYAAWRKSVASRTLAAPAPVEAPAVIDADAIAQALGVFERLRRRDEAGVALTDDERALRAACAKLGRREARDTRATARPDAEAERRRAEDQAKLDATSIRRARSGAASPEWFSDPSQRTLHEPRRCYVCRGPFVDLDAHYDRLCPPCAARERHKRAQTADLTATLAIVTGARVRIGFRVTLALLRRGASVIATTRFANDAWARFAREPDFESFRDRLEVRPIDLRFAKDVARFADAVAAEHASVDILVNNAAQTVARDRAYYEQLAAIDATALLPEGVSRAPALALVSDTLDGAVPLESVSEITAHSRAAPTDTRGTNSWRASVDDVSVGELSSTHAVNAIAPFVLLSRLRGALSDAAARRGGAYVVNVSAIEGQFSQRRKPSRHPHTNMAKAALNMLTLSVGEELARERVYVTSVDPGWISAQNPFAQDAAQRADGFAPPLDDDDAAARVLDPILRHKNGEAPLYGVLLKDYAVAEW